MNNSYKLVQKSQLNVLSISDIRTEIPDLKNIFESKSVVIAKWLINCIQCGLKDGSIKTNDVLPSKADFAYKLGVSIGTMQNAFRYIEDLGYVESKQCIGTLVKDYKNRTTTFRKLTSKRDLAVQAIKRYIISDGIKVGSMLPSSRTIATIIGFCSNTTRLALEYLCVQEIIEHKYKNSKEYGWKLKSLDFEVENIREEKSETIVDAIVRDLEKYIAKNMKIGDKLPSHMVLASSLKTSIKTVHDALKILVDREILLPKRGRYGTTVIKIPNEKTMPVKPEMSIFAPAQSALFYHYEKTQNILKHVIAKDYQIGEKLPSILELSEKFDLSPNTIRKALHNLSEEGYLVFSRGRYGGTFVIDIPEVESHTFKWLAVDSAYVRENTGINS